MRKSPPPDARCACAAPVDGVSINATCFQALYDAIGDGIAYTDQRGNVLSVNPAFCDLIGYESAEIIGKTMLDFTPEEVREDEARMIIGIMETGDDAGEFEKVFTHRNGHSVYVQVRYLLDRDENGVTRGLWGVVRDMTPQRAAEKDAALSQEQYKFLANNSEDVIWATDEKLDYTFISPSVEQLRGFTAEEVKGLNLKDSMTPASWRQVQEAVGRGIAAAERGEKEYTERFELELYCKDGTTVWVESVARALRGTSDRWIGTIGSTRDISARKQVEKKLKTNEEYLKALISATDDYVGLFSPEGQILIANNNLMEALGFEAEEVIGRLLFDVIPKEVTEELRVVFSEVVMTKETIKTEIIWVGRIFEAIFYPVVGDGKVTALASYTREVTEARFAEEARKKTQEQYQLIVETANEGILGLDANQSITYANEIVAEFFGYEVSELIGRPVTDFIETSELDDNARRIARRGEGAKERYERRFVRKDGTVVWALISASPMVGEDGSFLGAFAMIADITEVKQAHERMLTILDDMDADIYVSDLVTHEILFMNEHMRQKYGEFDPGTTCYKLIRDLDDVCSFCNKSELLDKNGRPIGTLVTERYHERLKRWHLDHDSAIEWLEGRLVHMHMAADITELKTMAEDLKEAMAEAEAANLAKNEFLANMSHEIRTPLNGLLGMLQLLQLTSLEGEQESYLDTAVNSGRNLLQILNDILDLSKVESGKLELEEHSFELGEVLDSVVSMFRHQAEGRGLHMRWTVDETLPRHFAADKGRLRQILFNLVGNAAKFTDSGSISVEAYPLKAHLADDSALIYFRVTDTGIGIPENKIDDVFDPFTQVDGSSTRKYQGTGLGLGIVRRLVRLMNGTIAVMSDEGEGTSIVFTIRARPLEQPTPLPESKGEARGNAPLSVLVAEDERVNRVVVERLLNKMGHEAVCVSSGEEAIERLKSETFDLMLTDIQMPGLDGVETTRVIRQELGVDIPIIALTAHAMKGDKERFLEAGMSGYIAKPFELAELEFEIDRVAGKADATSATE